MTNETDYDDCEEPRPISAEDPGARTWLLAVSGIAICVAVVLIPLDGVAVHLVGYVLAAPVAFALVALFRRASVSRFLLVSVGTADSVTAASVALLVAGLGVALAHAYAIAQHVA